MAIQDLKEQIARLPEQPGVYLYFNADGDTIYVGKARALRDRVRNYLGGDGAGGERGAPLRGKTRRPGIGPPPRRAGAAPRKKLNKQRRPAVHNLLRGDKNNN